MARKMMTKEVSFTEVKRVKLEVIKGKPEMVELDTERLFGSLTIEQAQKKFRDGSQVYAVETHTQTYEMSVEEFMKHAKPKADAKIPTPEEVK